MEIPEKPMNKNEVYLFYALTGQGELPEPKNRLETLLYALATSGGSGGSGTSNYNDLLNKPKINGVTLNGNKSLADLGYTPTVIADTITNLSVNSQAAGAKAVYDFIIDTISGVVTPVYEVVSSLPQTGQGNIIYLLPRSGSSLYDAYICSNGGWFRIGDTSVDLSGYAKTADVNTSIAAKENVSNKVTVISAASTDNNYPSAKAVYDLVSSCLGDISSALSDIVDV